MFLTQCLTKDHVSEMGPSTQEAVKWLSNFKGVQDTNIHLRNDQGYPALERSLPHCKKQRKLTSLDKLLFLYFFRKN